MDTVQNLKAFLAVARAGSFSAAAREARLATSVIAKRIDQLEAATGTQLFARSTRHLALTEAGRAWLARVQPVVSDVEELMATAARPRNDLAGPLRIKAPTTLAVLYLADMLARFQMRHPRIDLDIVLTDGALNPAEEGFDVAISVFGTAYGGVIDVPLCPVRRTLCAAPVYLAGRPPPAHPRDLVAHDTLSFHPTGDVWMFNSPQGPVQVTIRPRLRANDGQVLLAACRAGNGIALLSDYLTGPARAAGELVALLEEFTVPEIWMKALIPESRQHVARVRALVAALSAELASPPWQTARATPG